MALRNSVDAPSITFIWDADIKGIIQIDVRDDVSLVIFLNRKVAFYTYSVPGEVIHPLRPRNIVVFHASPVFWIS